MEGWKTNSCHFCDYPLKPIRGFNNIHYFDFLIHQELYCQSLCFFCVFVLWLWLLAWLMDVCDALNVCVYQSVVIKVTFFWKVLLKKKKPLFLLNCHSESEEKKKPKRFERFILYIWWWCCCVHKNCMVVLPRHKQSFSFYGILYTFKKNSSCLSKRMWKNKL